MNSRHPCNAITTIVKQMTLKHGTILLLYSNIEHLLIFLLEIVSTFVTLLYYTYIIITT